MVLFVSHATPHNYEAHLVYIPPGAHYVVYMLFLARKHILMPFLYTNNNIHVGKLLLLSKYGRHSTSQVRKTFYEFIKVNMKNNLPHPGTTNAMYCPQHALWTYF